MYIHTIVFIYIDCTHLATPLWCRCSCFDLSWKHPRRFAASKRFFVWTTGTGITSDLESLPRKFPAAGGACIAGRLRSFLCQRWGSWSLPGWQSPANSFVRDSELNVYLKEQTFPKDLDKNWCNVAISPNPRRCWFCENSEHPSKLTRHRASGKLKCHSEKDS